MEKTSISVSEMRRLLGMKKVEAYWLVKQGCFKVILVGGKMRIMLDSFEQWYGRQFHYKKVTGPEPGQLLPPSLTVPAAADILGLKLHRQRRKKAAKMGNMWFLYRCQETQSRN